MNSLTRLFGYRKKPSVEPVQADASSGQPPEDIVRAEIERLSSLPEDDAAQEAYWAHFARLPHKTQAMIGYEQARLGHSRGRSGFHGLGVPRLPLPFTVLGWADYIHPSWGADQGIAFRIEKDCFCDDRPLLYYLDDDNFPKKDFPLSLIETYSSGIADIHTERIVCRHHLNGVAERTVLLFTLDPARIRPTIRLSGKDISTDETGGYVFVLPRCGEFYCQLGERKNGEMIPLHIDDFCMK
ncbi:MAG: hypothetical protein IJE08_13645 [Clostridia bacterium]|nr:hypothetical protein [Clostridia bacterium]